MRGHFPQTRGTSNELRLLLLCIHPCQPQIPSTNPLRFPPSFFFFRLTLTTSTSPFTAGKSTSTPLPRPSSSSSLYSSNRAVLDVRESLGIGPSRSTPARPCRGASEADLGREEAGAAPSGISPDRSNSGGGAVRLGLGVLDLLFVFRGCVSSRIVTYGQRTSNGCGSDLTLDGQLAVVQPDDRDVVHVRALLLLFVIQIIRVILRLCPSSRLSLLIISKTLS